MFHYHVWFDLKPEHDAKECLSVIRSFLSQLKDAEQIAGYCLLRNTAAPPKSALLPYHALIEFADGAQFAAAFDNVRKSGIHHGLHGAIIRAVADFKVEVFESIEPPAG